MMNKKTLQVSIQKLQEKGLISKALHFKNIIFYSFWDKKEMIVI
jgi:hypothetical protein